MVLKPDQERVKNLLTDTVSLLCKNGLTYKKDLKIEGLLGITVDDGDVFIVHLNECFDEKGDPKVPGATVEEQPATPSKNDKQETESRSERSERKSQDSHSSSYSSSHHHNQSTPRKRQRPTSENIDLTSVKLEKEDDDDLLICSETKPPTATLSQNLPGQSDYYGSQLSLSDLQGNSNLYQGADGEPPTKRTPGEPYITGIKHHSDSSNTSWDNSQMGNSQQGMGWGGDPSQGGMDQQQMYQAMPWSMGIRRRPAGGGNLKCQYPGCGKAFYERKKLNYHVKHQHPGFTNPAVSTNLQSALNASQSKYSVASSGQTNIDAQSEGANSDPVKIEGVTYNDFVNPDDNLVDPENNFMDPGN